MFVQSQISDINNRDLSWNAQRQNNITISNLQGDIFQQQVNEIKNTINSRKHKSIADCMSYQPNSQQESFVRRDNAHQEIRPVHYHDRSQERCPVHNENFNIKNNPIQVRFSDSHYTNEPLVVVEKGKRNLKKNQYENELRGLRKTNSNLEHQLQDMKEFNYNMKSSLKQSSITNSTQQPTSAMILNENTATVKKSIPLAPTFAPQTKQETPQISNLYDNKKLVSQMVQSVSSNARKEALSLQEDGDEVKELKDQRNKEEEKRVKIVEELEKENTKLKNKAIRAQYEAEENEERIKQLENQRTLFQKDVKNKVKDLKTKENEITNQQNKKAKVESEMASSRLVLKDKESEITRLNEKLKLNAAERQKTLKELELNIQKRNIANLDFEKIRMDKDRIMEELEKRQVDANDKYNELQQKLLNTQNDNQSLDREATILDNFIEEEKKEIQKLQMQNKVLREKLEQLDIYERKLRKKEKTIMSLESELELARRERKIEIVEKVIEKPVVVEKPVIIEKEVVIKEEVKIDEPLEKELAILREEMVLLDNGLKEKTSEAEYWKKRYQDQELQGKHNIGSIQDTFHGEIQNLRIHYEKGIEEIKVLQGKLNALLAEIHTLSNINITKNREVQDQLHHLIKNNQSLENIIVANSYNSIPVSVQIPISSRYVSYH